LIEGFNSEIFIELHKLTTCLLFVSSSVNPFLYAFYGQRLRALILMKVAKVKHLFYPKKLMSAVGDNTSRSSSDRQLFDAQARSDNTSRIRKSVFSFFMGPHLGNPRVSDQRLNNVN
jgi:hypothetical protein